MMSQLNQRGVKLNIKLHVYQVDEQQATISRTTHTSKTFPPNSTSHVIPLSSNSSNRRLSSIRSGEIATFTSRSHLLIRFIDLNYIPQIISLVCSNHVEDNYSYTQIYNASQLLCYNSPALHNFLFNCKEEKLPALGLLFEFLKQEVEINQTSAGYFNKICKQIHESRQQDFILIMNKWPQLIDALLNHFYNDSICQFFQQLIQKETSYQTQNKTIFLKKLADFIKSKPSLPFFSSLFRLVKDVVTKTSLLIPRFDQVCHFMSERLSGTVLSVLEEESDFKGMQGDRESIKRVQILLSILAKFNSFYKQLKQRQDKSQNQYYQIEKPPNTFNQVIPHHHPLQASLKTFILKHFIPLLTLRARGTLFLNSCHEQVTPVQLVVGPLLQLTSFYMGQELIPLFSQEIFSQLNKIVLQSPYNNLLHIKLFQAMDNMFSAGAHSQIYMNFLQDNHQTPLIKNHVLQSLKKLSCKNDKLKSYFQSEIKEKYSSYQKNLADIDPLKPQDDDQDDKEGIIFQFSDRIKSTDNFYKNFQFFFNNDVSEQSREVNFQQTKSDDEQQIQCEIYQHQQKQLSVKTEEMLDEAVPQNQKDEYSFVNYWKLKVQTNINQLI